MLPEFLQPGSLGGAFSVFSSIGTSKPLRGADAVSVVRITEGSKAHIAASVKTAKLYVTSDVLAAKSALEKQSSYGGDVFYLPARDDVLVYRGGFSLSGVRERVGALVGFIERGGTLIVSADCLLQRLPSPALIKKYSLLIEKNKTMTPQSAADRLALAGYTHSDAVTEVGEFSVRGDALTFFSTDGNAYRVDFFDDLVEDIKEINPETMTSVGERDFVSVPPVSDVIIDETRLSTVKARLLSHGDNPVAAEFSDTLTAGVCPPAAVWATVFDQEDTATVFDWLSAAAKDADTAPVAFFDEPRVIFEKLNVLRKEFEGRLKTLAETDEILPEHESALLDVNEVKRQILTLRKVGLTSLSLSNPLFDAKLLLEPKCRPVTKYYLDRASVKADVNNFILNGFKVLFATGSEERAKAVQASLLDEDVFSVISADGNAPESVLVTPLSIESGFIYPEYKVAVIGVSECVGKTRGNVSVLPKQQFTAPKQGDYVVHRVHGVGMCEGTTIMKVGEFEKEFIVLRYRDGDKLYVSTDQTDNLQKFIGDDNPRLNKLGGREFEKEKEKVRASVRKLAVNLVELYARREKQKGYKYSADTVWQKEFEDSFEYTETADQLKAIEDVKRDMETGVIMDRVLIGDVGFGKTEVAFRAIFKTVLDAKQAVLLAPTTILARQHYETLKPRLQPFGIECALLSRLQTPAENRGVITRLNEGTLHVVVATHKVLGKDVKFNDLGLLVLDEEQRFGVEHKELLKERHPLVNVLTLSATPIPRTLNMALSGIRDISMLETPPQGRLPIQTYVVPYSDSLVKDAVLRECARGGQTLILVNNIEYLDAYASKLRSMLGDVRIVTAHGQMAAGELETRISAFYDKQYDVLLSTTIIENGIDIPDANTLIVLNSDRFGLSQLYQLRGRVGRRGVLAHAYFTLPENGTVSVDAEKRLQALLDNTEIGSGFKVALSDLSIRGAGTLLGAEQHGHIEKVGYEMYIELLNEAVEELKTGEKASVKREVEMKVDVPAFIREGYVGGRDKLRIYKRIASIGSPSSRDALLQELKDVFGEAEQPLVNLINVALLKNMAKNFDASRVIINRGGAAVNFYDSDVFKNEGLMRAAALYKNEVKLTSTIPPSLIFDVKGLSPEEKLDKLIAFFENALD